MGEAPQSVRALRFGVFELDLPSGELRKQGVKVKLQEQPFQVIAILADHAGEVVTREELRRRLWPQDTFVDFEHSLATAINKVREALGDTAQSPRFIETLPKRGYRFIAPVEPLALRPSPRPSGQQGKGTKEAAVEAASRGRFAPSGTPGAHRLRRWLVAIAGALVVTLGTLGVLNVAGLRERLFAFAGPRRSASVPSIGSIAVLPLENLSRDPDQDYFADGMTDELITTLGKFPSLRVISRTSVQQYKQTKKTLPQIARELNVDAVVEGTVVHSGGRVRITARLVYAPADRQLWADNFESDERDVLTLQSELAGAIADEIELKLEPGEQARLAGAGPINPEAHEAYLRALFFYYRGEREGLRKAIQYVQQAIQIDRGYAEAYALLAACYYDSSQSRWGDMPNALAAEKAKDTAREALKLDASLAEPHVVLGAVDEGHEWDLAGAEREFKQAIALDPNLLTAHVGYAWHLMFWGHHDDEAVQQVNEAVELDPVSEYTLEHRISVLFYTRHYNEAIEQTHRLLEMFPDNRISVLDSYSTLGRAFEAKGMYDQAVAAWQEQLKRSGEKPAVVAALGNAFKAGGIRGVWRWQLERLMRQKESGDQPWEVAGLYSALGERDSALDWLDKEAARGSQGILIARLDLYFDTLRSDPRYRQLMDRMKFPP